MGLPQPHGDRAVLLRRRRLPSRHKAYGGLQDNGTWGGPTRTPYGEGPINTDWVRIGGGDGFVCAVDPEDPDLVYYESQNGGLGRFDFANGGGGFMRPRAIKDVRYRFNWKTPFVLSNHNSRMFYCAGSYVFRSFDRGEEMEPISPMITRKRASATAIAESRHTASTLYVGTDDGALLRSSDFGTSWVDLFDLDAPARTLAAEEVERERLAAEKKAAEDAEKKAAKEKEKEAKALEKQKEEEARAAAARPLEPLLAAKGKLTGEGLPESSSDFRLAITRDAASGVVSVELVSEKLTAKGASGTFDPATGVLEIDLQSDTGSIHLSGKVEGEKMAGKLRLAGGLFEIAYQAEREPPPAVEVPAPAPVAATVEAAPPEPATAEPSQSDELAGEWSAELVGDQVPPGATGFKMLLQRDAEGKISGSTSSERGDGTIESASFDAAARTLSMTVRTERGTVQIEAKVDGEKMTGVLTVGGGAFQMDFEAKRTKAAPPPEGSPAEAPAPAPPQGSAANLCRRAESRNRQPPRKAASVASRPGPAGETRDCRPASPRPRLRSTSIGTLLPGDVRELDRALPTEAKRVYLRRPPPDDDQPWCSSARTSDTENLSAVCRAAPARAYGGPENGRLWPRQHAEFSAFVSVDRARLDATRRRVPTVSARLRVPFRRARGGSRHART